ncbi:hypothetical protein G7Y89_g5064 [Cudoniella acicularis]|uniref:Uncharacterized protein n=1 Tax=Cudoniella acicularis TaxID=354080 RepID=A0A8H4RN71_9HELO|nr:hypothetical protein G7Y89_g5064 [Cudoniella acicularis]
MEVKRGTLNETNTGATALARKRRGVVGYAVVAQRKGVDEKEEVVVEEESSSENDCEVIWLPLLFIPTNASPIFIFLFFVCTYFLNRPCVYCSFLLLILFASSCHWSDHCFFDFSSNWFEPRASTLSPEAVNSNTMSNPTLEQVAIYAGALNNTAMALAGTALEEQDESLR